jgi:hypothetical protein
MSNPNNTIQPNFSANFFTFPKSTNPKQNKTTKMHTQIEKERHRNYLLVILRPFLHDCGKLA